MLKIPAINFESDSSEEDEEIRVGPSPAKPDSLEDATTKVDINPLSVHTKDESATLSAFEKAQQLLALVQNVNFDEEEDEEEDEPLPAFQPAPEPVIDYGSSAFIESQRAISNDCWDINAWILFIEEAEAGRSGVVSVTDAYQRFVNQFPRASRYWRLFADHYIQKEEYQSAEELFRKCLTKCRSVGLWQSYLEMIKKKTIDRTSQYSDNYLKEKEAYKLAFEKALENIGQSLESNIIWRKYIDFIKNWPELTDLDKGRKLNALREVYRRAVCTPTDDLDQYWKEYEALEKKVGGDNQVLAEQVLTELQPKFAQAKIIARDRKKITSRIELDRIAVPPTLSMVDTQQLESWNKWLKYELTNPLNLPPESLHEMIILVYDQCISCMRLHPEIWISLAKYQQENTSIIAARSVYKEAIEIIPDVAILRLGLAELEENQGNLEVSRDVLRQAFLELPSAFTFATLQRFIRRVDGKAGARKCFSETLPLRRDGTLNYEVLMAHAQLELEVNQEPQTALRVIELARNSYVQCATDPAFIRLSARTLARLGDLQQLRWTFNTVLASKDMNAPTSISTSISTSTHSSSLNARDRYELCEEYLSSEFQLGLSDSIRLDELRTLRDRARTILEEQEKKSGGDSSSIQDRIGVFERPIELLERYCSLVPSLPKTDRGLKDRASNLGIHISSEYDMRGVGDDKRRLRGKKDETGSSGAGGVVGGDGAVTGPPLPPFLKDLMSRLPAHSGSFPDIDGAIEQLRRAVLPPKPAAEDFPVTTDQSSGTGTGVGSSARRSGGVDSDELVGTTATSGGGGGGKRSREEVEVLRPVSGIHYDEDDDVDAAYPFDNKGDIFRQRQRARLVRQSRDY
eukprot:gene1032-2022_t